MQVAGLAKWTYTHDVWKQMGRPGKYIPVWSNVETIKFLLANRWIGILPLENTLWWPVWEVLSWIWTLRESQMLGYIKFKVEHILAWSWSKKDIKEIHAHPQSFMQCSNSLLWMWIDINRFIDNMYRSPEMFDTEEFIIEIDDKKTTLADITKILSDNWINIEHLHSAPNGIEKYKFHMLVDNKYIDLMKSKKLIEEIDNIWWRMYQENYDDNIVLDPVKLVKRNKNTDWITQALEDSSIWVICSEEIANKRGLKILQRNFSPEVNETRFSIISTLKEVDIKQFKWLETDKTMGLLSLPNEVGSLHKFLEIIKSSKLSLSFIMSIANNRWWYDFPLVMEKWKNWEIMHVQKEIENKWWFLRVM